MYIGIDLGGTNIAVGLVSEDGKIIRQASTPTLNEREAIEIVKDMAMLIEKLAKEEGIAVSDIKSVGIGSPVQLILIMVLLYIQTTLKWICSRLQTNSTSLQVFV